MGLVEVHGKKTILKTGETEDKLSCPDKDFDAQAEIIKQKLLEKYPSSFSSSRSL